MSYFQNAVVKAESRALKVREGSLPYIAVSRKYEQKFYFAAFVIVALWATLASIINRISEFFSPFTLGLIGFWWLVSLCYLIIRFYRGYQTKALYQRLELRKARGDVVAAKERERLAEIAAQEATQRTEHAKRVEYNRVLYQMRLSLRQRAEEGVKVAVRNYREIAADHIWEPGGAVAKRIYEEVREDMKAANLPEYGLLRDTTDGDVGMVLGRDRSWLPPNMTDDQIAARHLPKPVDLTPPGKLSSKRKP